MALHGAVDIFISRVGVAFEQSRGSHDLSRLAVAALGNLLGDPRLLYGMLVIVRQPFDGNDVLVGRYRNGNGA